MIRKKNAIGIVLIGISLQFETFAGSVVLENSKGDNYLINVPTEESFQTVLEQIKKTLAEVENETFDKESSLSGMGNCIHLTLVDNTVIARAAAVFRNYLAPVTQKEAEDIGYIVRTLANKSLLQIKGHESSLKSAGDRIDHVHPFQFLACIFTNQELIVCMRNLQGRSWVWKDFLKGLSTSLTEEKARNNLAQYAQDLASRIKVDVNLITPHIVASKWDKLVDTLIKYVQREGSGGRYDM